MSAEGQIEDPESRTSDGASPEVAVFERLVERPQIGTEFRALLSLAIPVVLSELGWMTMTIVDLIMVGRLGPDAIGAVGLGNAIYYAPSLFGIGVLLGLDTLVSQSWGAGRFDDCHRSLAQAIYIAMAFTPVLMLGMLAGERIFTGRGVDPTVAALTRSYVSILNWGTFPLLVYGGFRRYLQGVAQVRPVTFALVSANLVNLAFNWIFIYGHFGFPALGRQRVGTVDGVGAHLHGRACWYTRRGRTKTGVGIRCSRTGRGRTGRAFARCCGWGCRRPRRWCWKWRHSARPR